MNLDGIIEDYPNTTTPLSKAVLTNLANAILGVAFPIGKIEMFYDAEDHSNYMGFTWERTAVGKVLVGIDSTDTDFNTIGKTGGEKAHTLTINEMPSHNHNIRAGEEGTEVHNEFGPISTSNKNKYQILSLYSGGNQPHNNLQPYQVVAFWKRIG